MLINKINSINVNNQTFGEASKRSKRNFATYVTNNASKLDVEECREKFKYITEHTPCHEVVFLNDIDRKDYFKLAIIAKNEPNKAQFLRDGELLASKEWRKGNFFNKNLKKVLDDAAQFAFVEKGKMLLRDVQVDSKSLLEKIEKEKNEWDDFYKKLNEWEKYDENTRI